MDGVVKVNMGREGRMTYTINELRQRQARGAHRRQRQGWTRRTCATCSTSTAFNKAEEMDGQGGNEMKQYKAWELLLKKRCTSSPTWMPTSQELKEAWRSEHAAW